MIMDASMVAAASAAAPFAPQAAAHRGHVFVVGQDAPALERLRKALGQQGYRVYVFIDIQVFLNQTPQDRLERLSPREREVMHLLQQGHTTQDIAKALAVSQTTAARHKSSILLKLNLRNIADWPYR